MKLPSKQDLSRFPWKLFASLVTVALFGSAGVVFGLALWATRDLPSPQKMHGISQPVKTAVYDIKGRVLHEFYKENRQPVVLRAIPRHLINATIATEDRSFYTHWGVDLWGMARAAITDITHGKIKQGGSTITQLLARNLFLTHERTVTRKIREIALAVELERKYSKDEILEMYFNQIYFGEGAYGVEAAAKTFFDKSVGQLSLSECALLAGIPANPGLYSPRKRPQAALARRDKVLRNMRDTGAISASEYENATHAPLGVTPMRYRNDRAAYFVEMVRLYLDENYGSNQVYEGGLKVWTTLDMDLQNIAERALEHQLSQLEKDLRLKTTRASYVATVQRANQRTPYLQGALVAVNPQNGYVVSLIGGRDWNQSNFNRAVQAYRQPGSAFKPFIYTAALDNGFHPTDVIVDEPVSFPAGDGSNYEPQNYDRLYRGPVTLRYALQQSINIPAIKLLRKVGTSLVASYARRMGIRTPIHQDLSLALGTSEVSLLELTTAYAVIDNRGIRNDPVFILKVEDRSGNVLEKAAPRPADVLSETTAAVMVSMMQSVMDHGTGYPARSMGFLVPAAGKTGTMDEYMDAWFVGFTPKLVCGVWVGYDEKKRIGAGMTGARAALPIWTEFMLGATRGRPVEDFPTPLGTVTIEICVDTGMLATENCPSVTTEIFTEGSEPTEYCTTHPGAPLHAPANGAVPRKDPSNVRPLEDPRRGREEIHL